MLSAALLLFWCHECGPAPSLADLGLLRDLIYSKNGNYAGYTKRALLLDKFPDTHIQRTVLIAIPSLLRL